MAISVLWGRVRYRRFDPGTDRGPGEVVAGPTEHSVLAERLLLTSVPLPIFFFTLYRTSVVPALGEGLRRTALASAIIRFASLAVVGRGVSRSLQPQVSRFFFATSVWHTISDLAAVSTRTAMILFLLVLFRQAGSGRAGQADDARLVRKVALIAAIAGALELTAGIGFLVSGISMLLFGARTVGGPGAWLTLRNIFFGIPAIAAPLIVYAGLRNPGLHPFAQTVAATGLD